MKNIANYKLLTRGKKLIRSAFTVYIRGKPRSSRSIQAKQHQGKGLFCAKKPPKPEDVDSEKTDFQRAHVKIIEFSFFGKKCAKKSHLCFMRSMNDKAYLQPGTSEGVSNSRNQKILRLTDVEKARKLPKYDCSEKLVHQTPGAHRIFTKGPAMADGKVEEKLITKEDSHFVFVRPKAIVESSGSTWTNETVRLRQRHSGQLEFNGGEAYSILFRRACATVKNACFLYQDMAERNVLSKTTADNT